MAEWYIVKEGKELGPFSGRQLKQLAATEMLQREDLVRRADLQSGRSASEVKGLFDTASSEPEREISSPAIPVPPESIPDESAIESDFHTIPPALWNPVVVRVLGFFNCVLAAFLTARNWKSLGDEDKARHSMYWFYGGIAFVVLLVIAPENDLTSLLSRYGGLCIFLAWAFLDSEKQVTFVKEQFGAVYPRKSWVAPVGVLLTLISFSGLSMWVDSSPSKVGAFKQLVRTYRTAPHGNVSVAELKRHQDAVAEAQARFAEIPFDPEKQKREAKAIADLYMQEVYGIYSGQLADDLYADLMTPILSAVGDDVAIPERLRSEWSRRY